MGSRPEAALDKPALGAELRRHLDDASRLRQARRADPRAADHLRLKAWQSQRLAHTHRALLDDPGYHAAAEFFLNELYGTKDFSARDAELARIVPTLVATLPARALQTLADAMRMDALSESLDAGMVAALRAAGCSERIDAASYTAAYRACGRRADREQQIRLTDEIGHTLDRLTRMPLLGATLKLMRRPAEAAGLGHLHRFLQQGFDAFRQMRSAEAFLSSVVGHETALMERVFAAARSTTATICPEASGVCCSGRHAGTPARHSAAKKWQVLPPITNRCQTRCA